MIRWLAYVAEVARMVRRGDAPSDCWTAGIVNAGLHLGYSLDEIHSRWGTSVDPEEWDRAVNLAIELAGDAIAYEADQFRGAR